MTLANTEYRELFAPITKMYDGPDGFFVEGTLVAEEPDRVGEIWDYESSKKSVLDWSEEAHRTTSGKSAGNLRAMHGNVAVGRFVRVEPVEQQKLFTVKAEVVDPVDKEKARKGVYSGFSIKAPYAKRWPDSLNPRHTRWTSGPIIEGSLVDLPCIKSATFAYKMVGTDGITSEETRRFATYADPSLDLDALADRIAEKLARGREVELENSEEDENEMDIKAIAEKRGLDPEKFKTAVEDVLTEIAGKSATKCMKSASECTDGDCMEHKGKKAAKTDPVGGDVTGGLTDVGGGEHTPSGDGIKMADGTEMVPYKDSKGNIFYRKVTPAVKYADLDTLIASKMAPITDVLEKLTSAVAVLASRPLPSAVGVRATDKTTDGKTDAEKAAAAAGDEPTAAKVLSLAKDGKPVDAIKMIHQMAPAQVVSNRGIQR